MAEKSFKRWIPFLFLLLVMAGLFWWAQSRRPPVEYPHAYVAEASSILWNANAQVRQAVGTLHYGDRVTILQRSDERAEVRADAGPRGWLDASSLMEAELWQQAGTLLARAKAMPVQALGHTRTISNIRLTAGRDGSRIFQFGRNEAVVVLERASRPAPVEGAAQPTSAVGKDLPKLEDWLLVLRVPPAAPRDAPAEASSSAPVPDASIFAGPPNAGTLASVPIAGWVLARFIELDPPAPIPDYLNAAGIRVVAWAVLNKVFDDESGPQPQYLVVGARGGEGQPCDFTLLRVYTWGVSRHRYETAYVENDVCGRMPIRVSSAAAGEEFRFADPMQHGADRVYRMRQTSVRRVTGAAAAAPAQPRGKQ